MRPNKCRTRSMPRRHIVQLCASTILLLLTITTAFAPSIRPLTTFTKPASRLRPLFALPEIANMRAGEMRAELESYGVSTKSFLEKSELVSALEQARAEGKQPQPEKKRPTSSTTTRRTTGVNGASQSSRANRIAEEMRKAQSMKVGDLKKELKARGVATKSFFEKSEFVRAYAEAVVDGVQKGPNGAVEGDYDPSYRDVVMRKMDRRDPRLLQGTVIDVKLVV